VSDDDKKTPRLRRQAISVASSGLSATSTPRFGKKSGMVSSGLSGLAAVMVEMTVPGQRRMALTPSTCPITLQSEAQKANSKSASTLVSSGDIHKDPHSEDVRHAQAAHGLEDCKLKIAKSLANRQADETSFIKDKDYRLHSSPNLSHIDDQSLLGPKDAILSLATDGSINGTHLFSNYDRMDHASDPESNTSDDRTIGKKHSKVKRKKREKSNISLSLSDRNISASNRKGSMTSPFLKRLVGLGRTRSNKGLNRTDSSESDKLLQLVNSKVPTSENALQRPDSSINILITGADSDNDASDNQGNGNKMISNGRRIFGRKPRRSISLLETP